MSETNPDGPAGKISSGDAVPAEVPRRPARPAQPVGTRLAPIPIVAIAATNEIEPPPPPAVARPAGPARPALPPQLRPAEIPSEPAEAPVDFTINDDDSVIMPAPPIETLASAPRHAPSAQRARYMRSLNTRRTLIPILLTCGVMFIAAATVRRFVAEDAILSSVPTWGSIVGYAFGGLLLAAAVLNMLVVRSELQSNAARRAAGMK